MMDWILTPDIQFHIIDSVMEWSTLHPIPNMRQYLLILLCYIFLFIPGTYGMMAKMKKLYYYKGVVVAGAMLTAVLIFATGRETRFEDTFCYYVRLCIEEDNVCRDQVYLQLQSPYNGTLEVTVNGDYDVYVYDEQPVLDMKGDSYEILRQKGGDAIVRLTRLHSFEQRRLLLANHRSEPGNELAVSLEETGDAAWEGTVVNTTDNRFVDVVLFLDGKYYYRDVLEAQETVSLDSFCVHEYREKYDWGNGIDRCIGANASSEERMTKEELASKEARARLLSEMFAAGYAPKEGEVCIFGFVVNGTEQFLREQEEDITGYTLYRLKVAQRGGEE